MTFSAQQIQSALKIGAVYAFALVTAVACSSPAPNATLVRGNGTAAVTADGIVSNSIAVEGLQTKFEGWSEDGYTQWQASMTIVHGQRKVAFDLHPTIEPFLEGVAIKTIAPYDYTGEIVCGNSECSRIGLMATIRDNSNGTVLNVFEYWDLILSTTAPQKRLMQTAFLSAEQGYESVTGSSLN